MQSTGIVRRCDDLGRLVLPMELRRSLNIANGDAIEIYVNEDQIVLKKYRPNMTCVMTGEVSDENVQFGDGMHLSKAGAKQLVKEIKKAFNV